MLYEMLFGKVLRNKILILLIEKPVNVNVNESSEQV